LNSRVTYAAIPLSLFSLATCAAICVLGHDRAIVTVDGVLGLGFWLAALGVGVAHHVPSSGFVPDALPVSLGPRPDGLDGALAVLSQAGSLGPPGLLEHAESDVVGPDLRGLPSFCPGPGEGAWRERASSMGRCRCPSRGPRPTSRANHRLLRPLMTLGGPRRRMWTVRTPSPRRLGTMVPPALKPGPGPSIDGVEATMSDEPSRWSRKKTFFRARSRAEPRGTKQSEARSRRDERHSISREEEGVTR
jgi:hypothetical protein